MKAKNKYDYLKFKIQIYTNLKRLKKYPIQYIKNLFHLKLYNYIFRYRFNKGVGKEIKLSFPPKYVTIAICGYRMNACKFCSSHCIDSKKNPKSNHQYKIPYFMTYEQFKKIVDMCYEAKVPHVHIVAAGEPFLNKEIFKIMDYLAYKYGKITIQTNFSKKIFQNKTIIKELLKRKDFIQRITTDMFSPDSHNKIKKGSDYNFVLNIIEYLSSKSNILFDIHTILTKKSFKNLHRLVLDLYKRNIRFEYNVVNLHPYNFNDFTSHKNVYLSTDNEIKEELRKLKKIGKILKIKINIPPPWDKEWEYKKNLCSTFWSRFQVVPDKNIPQEQWIGNVIPSQCNAVIIGKLNSLGNLLKYKKLMDFWNNPKFLKIRKNLINGIFPDSECRTCYIPDKNNFKYSV